MITVAHGNVHKQLAGVDKVLAGDPVAAGLCEAVRLPGEVRERYGDAYDVFFGGQGHPSSRWADTAALRRHKGTTHHGTVGLLLSEAVEPEKVAGLPRFCSTQLFDCAEGLIAFSEIHLHWIGPASDDASVPRVQQTHRGMVKARRLWQALEGMGYANVIVGDLNVPEEESSPNWLTPWEVFDQLGFQTVARWHLDGAALSPKLKLGKVETFRLYDHPGFRLNLTRRAS